MKFAEINKRYTEIVAEYLCKGYTINAASMNGSQGEMAHIDLTDGKEIIRVMVKTFSGWGLRDENTPCDGVEIIVGKCTDDVKPNGNDTWGTVWNNHLEVIHSERVFKIGRGDYYVTLEEAKKACTKRLERYKADVVSTNEYKPTAKAMEIAKRVVRKRSGCKRINIADVRLSKTENGYRVYYKNKVYILG